MRQRRSVATGVTMRACATALLAASLAASLAAPDAGATPPADPTSIWTLQDENASVSTSSLTDRYYVNGLRLGWTSGTDDTPGFLGAFAQTLWGYGQSRVAIDAVQQIYTAADTQRVPPDPRDRPYAGVLLGDFSLITDTDHARSVLGVSLGLVGPGAGGEDIQNGFHDLISQGKVLGWHYQIRNIFAGEALADRTWRVPVTAFDGLEVDALPEIGAGVGDLRDYAQAGATIRLGQGLRSDYGVPRLRPGLSGSDAFAPTQPFAWYAFIGGDGQAVGYDLLLESKPFRGGPHVAPKAGVGEAQAGLAIMAFGARLTYTQVFQTEEFHRQRGGLHQFGSLALSVRF